MQASDVSIDVCEHVNTSGKNNALAHGTIASADDGATHCRLDKECSAAATAFHGPSWNQYVSPTPQFTEYM
jgi:hypothetical protein